VLVTVLPNHYNFIPNPSFRTDMSGWETASTNLLTENQATGTGFTVQNNTTESPAGTYSPTGASSNVSDWVDGITPGAAFTVVGDLTVTGATRTAVVRVYFYNGGTPLAFHDSAAVGAGAHSALTVTAVAPAGTTRARVYAYASGVGAASGDTVTVARMSFHAGAGGNWAMPGVPITGLGKRTNDDGDLEFWDDESASWVGPYAEKATVGNLLPDNVASGTDTLGTIDGFTSVGGATLSSTTIDSVSGTRALRAVATLDTNAVYVSCPSDKRIPVTPGQVMTLTAKVKTPATTGEQWVARMEFTGVTTLIGPTTLVNNVSWTEVSWVGVVPEGATTVRWHFRRMVGATGAVSYFDNLSIHAGAGGNWAMPGAPITGLGKRVTHPNVDDVLAEQWDDAKGRWQTTHYDSGWRYIESLLVNGWTCYGSRVRLRRVNSTIYLVLADLNGSEATANQFLTLPSGFVGSQNNFITPVILTNTTAVTHIVSVNNAAVSCTTRPNTNYGVGVFPTDDAIPTSLPGALVYPAPTV
jgi:hypothetical protein